MSYDLTLWYAPRLRSFDPAMARLERRQRPSPRELASLRGVLEALASLDGALDEANGTVGLALSGSDVEEFEAILQVIRRHGMACYDPQEAVVYYANGADSRAEKAPGGVHEGVGVCVAELGAPGELSVRLECVEALMQFTLADSPDESAAAALALPALLRLLEEPGLRDAARNAAIDLCEVLRERGKGVVLSGEVMALVPSTGPLAAAIAGVRGL